MNCQTSERFDGSLEWHSVKRGSRPFLTGARQMLFKMIGEPFLAAAALRISASWLGGWKIPRLPIYLRKAALTECHS